MAYVIRASLEENPCPYAWYDVQDDPPPRGQERVSWSNPIGGPVRSEWLPRSVLRAIYAPRSYPCAEFNPDWSYARGGQPCVSQIVRDIIEDFEPHVHQLFPVDMLTADGCVREPSRYLLNVCTVVEGIIGGHYTRSSNGEPLFYPGSRHPMTVRKSRISKLHMWLDRRAPPSAIFVSDALYQKLEERKVGAFDLGIGNEK
jgi:hypothetical protein